MASIGTDGKVAYIYDQATDTWYPVAGTANTSSDYVWSGTHTHANAVTFQDVVTSQAGINNFQNPTARDAAIPTPTNGIVAFVRQNDLGDQINQLQYYYNGTWRFINDGTDLFVETVDYTLQLSDAGTTILMTSANDTTVTVPPNSDVAFGIGQKVEVIRNGDGNVTFVEGTGVVINSKYDDLSIAAKYSAAALVKTDTNTWLLIGDLTTI